MDKLAPTIVGTVPRGDEIEVGVERSIEVEFSEGMDGRRTGDAVFVSPSIEMRLAWHGRRLEIRPLGGLQAERTYVITVGTDARDLRGNRLDQSFTFAFATGGQLDRGSIGGRVLRAGKAAASAKVWAYHISEEFDGSPGVDPPAYETQSGRDGGYEFQRLAPGVYRVMAFKDADGDGTYDEGEMLGLPSGDVLLVENDEVQMGDLNLIAHGPAQVPELKRVQALHDRVIMLSFADAIEASQEVAVTIEGLPLEGTQRSVMDPSRWYLLTPKQEEGAAYSLSVAVDGEAVSWKEPVRGSSRVDRKSPALEVGFPTGELAANVDTVRLSFSEAMDPAYPYPGDDLWVRSDSTASPDGAWHWESPAALVFSPSESLGPGVYRLQVSLIGLRDRAGLAPADSSIALDFEVLPEEDLGSIGGAVIDVTDSSAVRARVVVQRVRDASVVAWDYSHADGRYMIDGLAPGQYDVHCIDDVDGNGIADGGQLHPYQPAERHQSYKRSISLSRGEQIDGIDFEFR